jgi:hypothetical protein
MKRVYIILIFSVLVLAVNAQNYFGVSLGLLTTYQLDNVDNTTARLGGGGEIGAIYQLQRNNFLFQTGLGLNYSVSILGVDSMPLSANMIDTEGTPFTYKGIVYDRVDRANVTELSVPLMLGFNISSFYALIGAKFVYPLMSTTRQTALLTTYGDYNGMFYEDFFDMPQHGYANAQPAETIGQTDFSYDVRACVELGGRWSLSGKKSLSSQLQVGLFAEYGVLNTLKGGNNNLVDVDYSKYMSVKMNHIYTTLSPSLASVYNLRIGLRASLLFPVADFNSKHKKCMCIDYVNRKHSVYRKRR